MKQRDLVILMCNIRMFKVSILVPGNSAAGTIQPHCNIRFFVSSHSMQVVLSAFIITSPELEDIRLCYHACDTPTEICIHSTGI